MHIRIDESTYKADQNLKENFEKLRKDIGAIAKYISTNHSDSTLAVLQHIQETFKCTICHQIVRDAMPYYSICSQQFSFTDCLVTWRAQSAANGCVIYRRRDPTLAPLAFAGVKDFMVQFRRIPFILDLASPTRPTTTRPPVGSPTFIEDSLNDAENNLLI